MIRFVENPDMPLHRIYLTMGKKLLAAITDLDGIEPSPQPDGDPRDREDARGTSRWL